MTITPDQGLALMIAVYAARELFSVIKGMLNRDADRVDKILVGLQENQNKLTTLVEMGSRQEQEREDRTDLRITALENKVDQLIAGNKQLTNIAGELKEISLKLSQGKA